MKYLALMYSSLSPGSRCAVCVCVCVCVCGVVQSHVDAGVHVCMVVWMHIYMYKATYLNLEVCM